jgi:hypothetical protein
VIIGAGEETNGRPVATGAVQEEDLLTETYPDLLPVAWTPIVLPTSEAVRV